MATIVWTPTSPGDTVLARFRARLAARHAVPVDLPYADLHRWTIEHPGIFWSEVWEFAGVIGDRALPGRSLESAYVPAEHMTEARWFPQGKLNFAENLLRPAECDDTPALLTANEAGERGSLSRRELLHQAMAFARYLTHQGVGPGDRVAAVVPNIPEAVVAMLGTTAIGAIWSSCSPDFGDDAICDRFSQIEPKVLITVETARYAGKVLPVGEKVRRLLPRLPTLQSRVLIDRRIEMPDWDRFDAIVTIPPMTVSFERFPFAQPTYILYSSGTTGAPKCIVHGAGGTLLQHLKEHQLHSDIRPGDRVMYYTTTGWMMWNWLVSALASRTTVVLYDGSPFHPGPEVLWQVARDFQVTQFGTSAKYLAHLQKLGFRPARSYPLPWLRTLLSTGSPLLPEGFDYIVNDVAPGVAPVSISGGTDLISCFALGCPMEPIRRGEIAVKGLGMDVQVWDPDGRRIIGTPGELVCPTPFPSMPVGFWNDPDGSRYRASYFEVYDNVWCHGDWAEERPEGGLVITGRSDTTLNPGGVRIGTAELYRQVETFPAIAESLATALRRDGDERIVLFVRMQPGEELTPTLIEAIRRRLREQCSPRHVPTWIVAVADFPRTISGKVSEVAVRNVIHGLPVKNQGALANPETLAIFAGLSFPEPG